MYWEAVFESLPEIPKAEHRVVFDDSTPEMHHYTALRSEEHVQFPE